MYIHTYLYLYLYVRRRKREVTREGCGVRAAGCARASPPAGRPSPCGRGTWDVGRRNARQSYWPRSSGKSRSSQSIPVRLIERQTVVRRSCLRLGPSQASFASSDLKKGSRLSMGRSSAAIGFLRLPVQIDEDSIRPRSAIGRPLPGPCQ